MTASPALSGTRKTVLIGLLAVLVMTGPLAVDMYLPSLPAIAVDLAEEIQLIQQTVMVFLVGFGLGMLVYGPISDIVGRRVVILGGMVLLALASVYCATADGASELFLGRFLQAVGGGAVAALARAVAKDHFDATEAAQVLSLMGMVMAVAPLLAPTLGAQILLLADWRAIFVVIAVFSGLGFVATLLLLQESLTPEMRTELSLSGAFLAYGRIIRDRTALGYLLSGGFTTASMFAYITGTPFVYISYFGVPPEWFGALFGANVLAIMLGSYLNARLVRQVGIPRMTLAGILVGAVGGAGILATGVTGFLGLWGIAAPLLLVVGVNGVVTANNSVRLMDLFPRNAGAASALFGAVRFAIGAAASGAVGLLHDGTPLAMTLVIAVCCLSAPVALMVLAGGEMRRG